MINVDQALERIAAAYAPIQGSRRELQIRDHGLFREGLTPAELERGSVRMITEGDHCRLGSANESMQRFLFETARERRPKVALEFGTCFGVSTAALAFGMDSGRLVSVEADVTLAELARDQLERLGLGWVEVWRQTFRELLGGLQLDSLESPIELVFDDGDHSGAERERFDVVLPFCAPQTLFIWDDIRWSVEMHDWWRDVSQRPEASDVRDLGRCGALLWTKVSP
jgi:predicted O-methyltransferase YrrM